MEKDPLISKKRGGSKSKSLFIDRLKVDMVSGDPLYVVSGDKTYYLPPLDAMNLTLKEKLKKMLLLKSTVKIRYIEKGDRRHINKVNDIPLSWPIIQVSEAKDEHRNGAVYFNISVLSESKGLIMICKVQANDHKRIIDFFQSKDVQSFWSAERNEIVATLKDILNFTIPAIIQ